MMKRGQFTGAIFLAVSCAFVLVPTVNADVPLGGFIPYVGIGLTKQFETFDSDPDGTFFIADPSDHWSGVPLNANYFDLALLDTGAATHILTQTAAGSTGFNIQGNGFKGTQTQKIFGATGPVTLTIDNPLGVYAAGLSHSSVDGNGKLVMDTTPTGALRGQTSFALLDAPSTWKLPNIIGLPMASQHAIAIRNSQPQIFQYQGRTVRTPQVDLLDLGTGGQQGITRRTNLRLHPSDSFLAGPLYQPGGEIGPGGEINFHKNPTSPSVISSGGLYVEVDISNAGNNLTDKEILFDTGADLTVFSEVLAASIGLDVVLDEPDFVLEVEAASGVVSGVPGYYVDQLKIDAVGGPIILQHVPVAVLDVPNPIDPANTIDAILGMHLFNGRNLVIDAIPAATGNGASPRLYISDPITQSHTWVSASAVGTWSTGANWSASGTPASLWAAEVTNTTASDKTASVTANSTIFQLNVAATSTGKMILDIQSGATLTTFAETQINSGGTIVIQSGGKLDAQLVDIYGGKLAGKGAIFVGSGPVNGVVRNLGGRVAPGTLTDPIGVLAITGDFSNQGDGILAIDLAGTNASTQVDRITATRDAFLGGTLEVSLIGFTPSINDVFTILTATQAVSGQFDHLVLPAGYTWNVTYGATNVVVTVTGLGLDGDFNGDNKVDTADYVALRKSNWSPQNYQLWRSHYGTATGAGAGNSFVASVPEPTSILLVTATSACLLGRRRRRRTIFQPARS